MSSVREGTVLWKPPEAWQASSALSHYRQWLSERGQHFASYAELWQWSTRDLAAFWGSLAEYFGVAQVHSRDVLPDRRMPGAVWFPGVAVNYAEHVFRARQSDAPALLWQVEGGIVQQLSWSELQEQTRAAAAFLRQNGVGPGDRVAAYLPNLPETVAAFLACASIGAIWSAAGPEFGVTSVLDRFQQIDPTVLFAVDGYRYQGRWHDRRDAVRQLEAGLPSLRRTVWVSYPGGSGGRWGGRRAVGWGEVLQSQGPLQFTPVPFQQPLWVLYSSGTTGLPKAMVHGHGGIILEHLKSLALHLNLHPGNRFAWYTSTGWMMWNFLVGGLLRGCTVALYDGSPAYPTPDALWRFAGEARLDYLGTSAAYLNACRGRGLTPGRDAALDTLWGVGSTGSPLSPEAAEWVYDAVKPDLWLGSISGGTDLCTAFVLSCPWLPVRAGELQCLGLGAKVAAYDGEGHSVTDTVGDLVIEAPMPSMPVMLWNDPEGRRYRSSYFATYPGVWRHGDWIRVKSDGSAVIYGRSDATLNRDGVRIGTAELYRVVEAFPEVEDSLVVDLGEHHEIPMPMFLVAAPGFSVTPELEQRLQGAIRQELSPRHCPNAFIPVPGIPKTLNGKKLEVPLKRLLQGEDAQTVLHPDTMANPESLPPLLEAWRRMTERPGSPS